MWGLWPFPFFRSTRDDVLRLLVQRFSPNRRTAGGENIAPVPIEDQVKAACDGINEAPP